METQETTYIFGAVVLTIAAAALAQREKLIMNEERKGLEVPYFWVAADRLSAVLFWRDRELITRGEKQ